MTRGSVRFTLSAGVALGLLGALGAPGCSSSHSKKVFSEPDASGAAGEGGAGEGGAGEGGAGEGGGAGGSATQAGEAGTASVGGDSGAAGEGTAGAPSGAGGPGTGGSSGGVGGGTGGGAVDIDAGVDCLAPNDEAPLSAASAGLPSAGLALWLRADHGVYMTAANRVCAWADQSAQGALFVPAADLTRPLWEASGVGTAPAVHFDAAGRFLLANGVLGIAPTSARTFIAVVKLLNTSARCETLEQGLSGTGEYLELDANTFNTAGNREGVVVMNNAYDSGLATGMVPRVHVYTLNNMTVGTPILDAVDYRVNGATQALTRTGGSGNGTFEDFSGANYTAVGACPDALIAEVLVYDRALTVPERSTVEASLEARYAIQ